MRIAVLGTGMVGQALAGKLAELGHEVMMGSRAAGNEKAVTWVRSAGGNAREGSFADAAGFGEILINATSGEASLDALQAAGSENLQGKVLIDVSNPIAADSGFPPTLSIVNDDSLGERIQAAFPAARVVKTLNTMSADVMVNPGLVPGDHAVFLSGDDAEAKEQVRELLGSFGWADGRVFDLGDISTARGTEMYLAFWIRMMISLGSPHFNIEIRRA